MAKVEFTSPEDLSVSCAAQSCPQQVGMLFFAARSGQSQIFAHGCTAFLLSSDLAMSAGHCDFSAQHKGYFISQSINGKKEIRSVRALSITLPSRSRADIGFFKLDRPIVGLHGLRLAGGMVRPFNKLIVFALKSSSSPHQYLIQRHECTVRRHESLFPFSINENPDLIRSFGCQLERAASGAPMFAPGSDEVQAIHSGTSEREGNWSSVSSNARCINLPDHVGEACLRADQIEIKKRFQVAQRNVLKSLESSRFLGMRALIFQLSPMRDMRFEVVHYPVCKNQGVPFFVIEQIRIQFNEWAEAVIESLSEQTIISEVKSTVGDNLELMMNWPRAAGAYLHPEFDLRKKWGPRFHIALRNCPR